MNDSLNFDFYLASASPRRRDLLKSMGFEVKVCPSDIDESPLLDELPVDYVQRLSIEKARTAYTTFTSVQDDKPFMGSDTIVVCRGQLFGKPKDRIDAMRMWQIMSGEDHQVLTAITLLNSDKEVTKLSVSKVTFCDISEASMDVYWKSGEPKDKAGAYGIQGLAAAWVESIDGSYSGIMGLPLFETNEALKSFDLNWM
jgi:septum formation protein